jgi:TonB family protein
MSAASPLEVYSPGEVAEAAGVLVDDVIAAAGGRDAFITHDEAVRIGRTLRARPVAAAEAPLFSLCSRKRSRTLLSEDQNERGVRPLYPLAVSSTLHAAILAVAVFVTAFGPSPSATSVSEVDRPPRDMHLVFLATPGPGGGGGGGGLQQPKPAPKALRQGAHAVSSPLPVRRPRPAIEPAPKPPEPEPQPIAAEPLPVLVAPIVTAPADSRDRIGVLQQASQEAESHGPGKDGGAGTGTGTGLGQGQGPGVGPGSGGGTGGGPYRPGSGIEPPRLLREVRAGYSDAARRRAISGEVVLEIVVRRDGSVGDVKILRGLEGGLNENAVEAVRQWRFSPARRQGSPVDVIVQVSVDFKLR